MTSIASVVLPLLFGVAQAAVPPYLLGLPEFPPHDHALVFSLREGLEKKEAARLLASDPGGPETIRALARVRDAEGTLTALRAAVDGPSERMAHALEALGGGAWQFRGNSEQALRRVETLRHIVEDARRNLAQLDRESAARVARVLIGLDGELARDFSQGARARLPQFIEEYRGTAEALLAEVDLIAMPGSSVMLEKLEAFAAAHEGSTAAAKARYQVGFQLHTINLLGKVEPRGGDSTARFFRVVEIVRDLESGRYPPSEWVRRAPDLVIGFFIPSDARIPPENIDRIIAAHIDFVRGHWTGEPLTPNEGLGYLISSRIPQLVRMKGEGDAAVDRLFADLGRVVPDRAAIGYLHALQYFRAGDRETAEQRPVRLAKMRSMLAALAAQGTGPYHRRALAALASQDLADGNFAEARGEFQKYVATYPQSGWAWVAQVRAGQCAEQLGQAEAAASEYLRAATAYPSVPIAQVVGFEYAARAHELTGELGRAIVEHERALARWDSDFGLRYSVPALRPATDPFVRRVDAYEVTKASLPLVIARLKRSAAMRDGKTVERGRALLARGRRDEALAVLAPLATAASSPARAEALALSQRARLQRALELADLSRPESDAPRAVSELEAIAGEPYSFEVTAARIALGSLAWKQGDAAGAEKQMERALSDWHERQPLPEPATALERDLAAIRTVVFRPTGGGVYGVTRWNAFSWPATPPRFSILRSDVPVKDHSGEVIALGGSHPVPGAGPVLFLDADQLGGLEAIMVRLGGTRRREPTHVMETPNQPVGESMQILRLWERFFPARPGHWGGWELQTYPAITEILFTNAERTRAAVKVTVGYSGATVEMEKENGVWVAKRLSEQWIT